jgi:hypothetical protein
MILTSICCDVVGSNVAISERDRSFPLSRGRRRQFGRNVENEAMTEMTSSIGIYVVKGLMCRGNPEMPSIPSDDNDGTTVAITYAPVLVHH